MGISPAATVIYGPDMDDPEEHLYALVFISRKVWEAQGEWLESYSDPEFEAIYDELLDSYDLDPLMENYLAADDQESFDALLKILEADPRLHRVADVYDLPEAV